MIEGKRTVASILLVAVAGPVLAEDTFRYEAGASFSRRTDDDSRRDAAGVDATYYFDDLPTRPTDTPYDQVRFVERVGALNARYTRLSSQIDNVDTLSKGNEYGATLVFARPDTFLRAAAEYDYFAFPKTRSAFGTETENKTKLYALSLGAYVAKTTSVDVVWARSKSTSTSTSLAGSSSSEATADELGLTAQHLLRIGEDHLALTASAAQLTIKSPNLATEKNHEFLAQATYYPSQALGLTLGIATERGDNASLVGERYLAGAKMYFTPAFSVSLDYQKFNAKTEGNDSHTVALRAALRF